MNRVLVEWQRIDSENGLVEPWLTWPFMDEVKKWNLSDKILLEFGSGLGSAWWWKKCKWVDSIESNQDWGMRSMEDVGSFLLHDKGQLHYANIVEETEQYVELYFGLIPKKQYDIILIDGIFRYECLKWSINHFKGRTGILIFDNWDQDYVFISEEAEQLMGKYEINIFQQPGHIVHEGKPWKTVYWHIK